MLSEPAPESPALSEPDSAPAPPPASPPRDPSPRRPSSPIRFPSPPPAPSPASSSSRSMPRASPRRTRSASSPPSRLPRKAPSSAARPSGVASASRSMSAKRPAGPLPPPSRSGSIPCAILAMSARNSPGLDQGPPKLSGLEAASCSSACWARRRACWRSSRPRSWRPGRTLPDQSARNRSASSPTHSTVSITAESRPSSSSSSSARRAQTAPIVRRASASAPQNPFMPPRSPRRPRVAVPASCLPGHAPEPMRPGAPPPWGGLPIPAATSGVAARAHSPAASSRTQSGTRSAPTRPTSARA